MKIKNDNLIVNLVVMESPKYKIVLYEANGIKYLQFNGYPVGTHCQREYFQMGYNQVLDILQTNPQLIVTNKKRISCHFLVFLMGDDASPILQFEITNDKDWVNGYNRNDCLGYMSFSSGITFDRLVATSHVKTSYGYMHPAQSFTLSESNQKLIE